jgi:hypothetical protein
MRPLRLAITASLLGPALLLGTDPLWWGLLLLLLPLNTLAALFAGPVHPGGRRAALLVPLVLLVVPVELALVEQACRVTGLAESLPLPELSLVLVAHLGAFLLLLDRGSAEGRRRRGVQAACWLPLPLAALGLLAWLPELPRLLVAALLLLQLQRAWAARGGTDILGAGGLP